MKTAVEIMSWIQAGGRFYEPGWPPHFEPQPYIPRQEMTDVQKDNMRRGRVVANERVRAAKAVMRTGRLAPITGTNFNPSRK